MKIIIIILIICIIIILSYNSSSICNNNCPINKFPDITKDSNSDILYSIYQSYQTSFTPNYISNNLIELTNTSNYSNLPMGPSNIFIIRHGEKNINNYITPTNQNTYHALNCNGIKRSTELPDFINNLGCEGFPITAIVTCNPDMNYILSNGNMSIRTQTTISISAWLLNIPLYIYSTTNVSQPYDATTAINIFTNPYLQGKNIVIAFDHDNIQALTNQIVQCYIYFQQGGTIQNLNNSTLHNISTQLWWEQNTPVSIENQYDGFQPKQEIPKYPIPYQPYSKYLPYWNTTTYDKVYWLSQINIPNNLTFNIFYEKIYTCFQSCHLLIGLIQYPLSSNDPDLINEYSNDIKCLLP